MTNQEIAEHITHKYVDDGIGFTSCIYEITEALNEKDAMIKALIGAGKKLIAARANQGDLIEAMAIMGETLSKAARRI